MTETPRTAAGRNMDATAWHDVRCMFAMGRSADCTCRHRARILAIEAEAALPVPALEAAPRSPEPDLPEDPEPIANETESGYALRREIVGLARRRARAKLLLEGMSQLQYQRGRLSKITVEDAERLLAHLDGWLPQRSGPLETLPEAVDYLSRTK